jgi:hypothetical protein
MYREHRISTHQVFAFGKTIALVFGGGLCYYQGGCYFPINEDSDDTKVSLVQSLAPQEGFRKQIWSAMLGALSIPQHV